MLFTIWENSVALASGIWFEKFSHKKRSKTYTFGYRRFSLLSALLLNVFLIVGALFMSISAISRFFGTHEVLPQGMFVLAIFGVAVNGLAFWRMHKSQQGKQHNSQAMMLHFLEDVLGWVAVLVGSILIYFTKWYWIDPLISIGISIFILSNAVPNLLQVMKIFMQAIPDDFDVAYLVEGLQSLNGVKNVHAVQVWTLDGDEHVLTAHLQVPENQLENSDLIREKAIQFLNDNHIHHVTIQIESKTLCETCQEEILA